jgi:S1-C subfamily serine protease
MKTELRTAITTILFIGSILAGSSKADDFDNPAKSVVSINAFRQINDGSSPPESKQGTGFIVSDLGYVLTASHVLYKDDDNHTTGITASFSSRSSHSYPLTVVYIDPQTDIALLMLPDHIDQDLHPLIFGASAETKVGDRLLAYGFPIGQDLTLKDGILSAKAAPRGRWRTTVALNPGQSGSPIFNTRNEVVAIAVAGDEHIAGSTYAIPESYSIPIRQMVSAYTAIKSRDKPKNIPITEKFFTISGPIVTSEVAQRLCIEPGYVVRGAYNPSTADIAMKPKLTAVELSPNCVDATYSIIENPTIRMIHQQMISLIGEKPNSTSNLEFRGASLFLDGWFLGNNLPLAEKDKMKTNDAIQF